MDSQGRNPDLKRTIRVRGFEGHKVRHCVLRACKSQAMNWRCWFPPTKGKRSINLLHAYKDMSKLLKQSQARLSAQCLMKKTNCQKSHRSRLLFSSLSRWHRRTSGKETRSKSRACATHNVPVLFGGR